MADLNGVGPLSRKYLPSDGLGGTLVGRAWVPAALTGSVAGPSPVLISEHGVLDACCVAPTMAELLAKEPVAALRNAGGFARLGSLEEVMDNTLSPARDQEKPYFLAPVDIQPIKACGVTFACSMLERVIEESAGGDPAKAAAAREKVMQAIGGDIASVKPGSTEAMSLKAYLQSEGMWSQYLEVGIGPHAEVFTKSQALSSVGLGDQIGIHPVSKWNNPEPEVLVVVNPEGEIVGATLGNDVNLRDVEGWSALLLGKAKDNNASCSIGPFIRLFDESFSLDDVRNAEVTVEVYGEDNFRLKAKSDMSQISRDVTDLVSQTMNENHQYPDGIALFTGTLFAPVQDRGEPGMGFTHKIGDKVVISSPKLGRLENTVVYCKDAPPWTFGMMALMKNLKERGL